MRPLAVRVDLKRLLKIIYTRPRTGKHSQDKPGFFRIRIQYESLHGKASRSLAVTALQGILGVQ
jgi:hypothetical protein